MNVIVEETLSSYLISWCGYDKTRENKIIIHERFRTFKKFVSNFFLHYSSPPVPCPSRLVWDRD